MQELLFSRGRSLMVKPQSSKLITRVRFPSSPPHGSSKDTKKGPSNEGPFFICLRPLTDGHDWQQDAKASMLYRGYVRGSTKRTPPHRKAPTSVPRPKRPLSPLLRKYLKTNDPSRAEARGFGDLKPAEPAGRRNGAPLAGHDQVYVMKRGTEYHTAWCGVVADKWDHAPRGLLVTLLTDVGERTRCRECERRGKRARTSPAQKESPTEPRLTEQPMPEAVIPLRVIGVAHGILFLAAGPEHRALLKDTAVEPATVLSVGGRRDGTVVRLDAGPDEPLLLVQLDPRATFRNGPYQVRLRRPLQRSATKAYAVAAVEPA